VSAWRSYQALESPQILAPQFKWLMSTLLTVDDGDAPSSLRSALCTSREPSDRGRLIALRTSLEGCAEADTTLQTLEAYIADVPRKSANSVLRYVTLLAIESWADCCASVVDSNIRTRDTINLQHLRRFVKPAFLPPYLQDQSEKQSFDARCHSEDGASHQPDILHFLVCAVRILAAEEVSSLLSSSGDTAAGQQSFHLRSVSVPLLPPSSAEEAEIWSRQYWPTIFKKSNPLGPHPSIVARAAIEISDSVAYHVRLARRVGEQAHKSSKGLSIGAVVVDRCNPTSPTVVAAAGDSRWTGSQDPTKYGSGNVTGHAVMRAISFVAHKRRDLLQAEQYRTDVEPDSFAAMPLTDIERATYTGGTLAPGGYLCLDLEIYVTHEPCVMCSMAILHSRFSRVVFGQHMPHTGGLTAETVSTDSQEGKSPGTRYGLFWRPELNWKLLAWQWVEDEPLPSNLDAIQCHA